MFDVLPLLLQVTVIVVAARVAGILFRSMGQPPVVGEMLAGILLGPTCFGRMFPLAHAWLFPGSTRPALAAIAHTAVILFMFVVGSRIELGLFRRHTRIIASASAASIAVPFLAGIVLAQSLHPRFAAATVAPLPFILFIATALSVTAFPVLARILADRGLQDTTVGRTALVCAAINDVVAWGLVAFVVGLVRADAAIPLAVHGVFIAFVLGVAAARLVPHLVSLAQRIERPTSRYLLPIFFALVGLRVDLHLVAAGPSLFWCLAIVMAATLGKLGGTAVAAAAAGMSRSDAWTLGILMNTRGLMELVVLNIGHELGLLPPLVFTMMVVMALVTTCMTGPLLSLRSLTRPPARLN